MSEVSLEIAPPSVYLRCPLHEGYRAHQIGWGAKYDKRARGFRIPFGPETLIAIKKVFPEAKVRLGQQYVDQLKRNIILLNNAKNQFSNVEKKDLREHFKGRKWKLDPYFHQLQGMFYMEQFPGAALFADCGAGKTSMTLWDVERCYSEGLIRPSSTLVLGKLMTLQSGWLDDTSKFTNLSALNIWQPGESKLEQEELYDEVDHGPKPEGKPKYFQRIEYLYHNGEIAILENTKAFNPKKHLMISRKWKEVDGVKYGMEQRFQVKRRNIRQEKMEVLIKDTKADIHILNHEDLIKFTDIIAARNYEYIVVDESTVIKNPKAKIFAALMQISKNSKFRRILSGTPSPQGPQDLWSQFYFLDNGLTFGPSYAQFLEQHFDLIQLGSRAAGTFSGFKIALSAEKNTMGYIHRRLEHRIFRCRLRDCVELPPISISKLDVYLTDEQLRHYDSMAEAFFAEVDGTRIEVTIDLARIGKLRQITGGFLLNNEGKVTKVSKKNPKLDTLLDYLTEIGPEEKIVIFAVFRCEIEMLLKTFGNQAVAIYGGETDVNKIKAQEKFKNDPSIRYIICQPQSAAYGVNGLTVARHLIFYSIDFRADCNYQAIKRIERTGQKRAMVVKYLVAKNSIDEVIHQALYRKDNVQQETINQAVLTMRRRN